MKNYLLQALLMLVPCMIYSQLRLVKDYTGSGNGQTYSLNVVDNDLVFAMQINNSGADRYGVYSSNGTAEGTLDLSLNRSELVTGTISTVAEGYKAILNEDLEIGSDLFMYLHQNSPGTKTLFKLNAAKTGMDFFDNITDTQTNDLGSRVIAMQNDKIAMYKVSLRTEDTITDSRDFDLKIHTKTDILNYAFNGVVNREAQDYSELSVVVDLINVFFFQDELWLEARNTRDRIDLYKYFNGNLVRITQDFTTVNGDGVNPEYMIPTENYIYFSGDFVSGSYQDNSYVAHGMEVCFTNNALAATTPLNSVRGYNIFETQRNAQDAANSSLLAVSEDAIYYHSSVNNTVSAVTFDENNIAVVQSLFSVPPGGYAGIKAFTRGNTAYFLSRDPTSYVATIYITQGQPQDVQEVPFPDHPDGAQLRGYNPYYDVAGDKLYISGSYYPSSGRTYNILSFDFETHTTEIAAEFPDAFPGGIGKLKYYCGGFAVNATGGGIYTLDTEVRSGFLGQNSSRDLGDLSLSYDGIPYETTLVATDLATTDSLKIQLLDTGSVHFKEHINALPSSDYATKYYRLNTLTEGLKHRSTLTLSYADTDFESAPQNLELVLFKDGAFTALTPDAVNTTEKTITITADFEAESILFLRSTASLSMEHVAEVQVTVYPNPTTDALYLDLPQETIEEVMVYNMLGQRVLKPKTSQSIDVSMLKPGVYLLKLKDQDQRIRTHKFIKR